MLNGDLSATAAACGAAAALLILLHPSLRAADADPAVPRYVAYKGTLYQDGARVDGTAELVFRLYASEEAADALWEETLTVSAYAGEFEALFGSSSAASLEGLATALAENDDVHLGISVVTGQGELTLSDRQRFLPMPYASWAAAGTSSFQTPAGLVIDGQTSNGLDEGALILRSAGGGSSTVLDGDGIDSGSVLSFNSTSGQTVDFGGDLAVESGDVDARGGAVSIGGQTAIEAASSSSPLAVNPDGSFASVNLAGAVRVYSGSIGKSTLTIAGALTTGGSLTLGEVPVSFGSSLSGASLTVPGDVQTKEVDFGLEFKFCTGTSCSCDEGTLPVSGGSVCGGGYYVTASYPSPFDERKWLTECTGTSSDTQTQVLCGRIGE